ncbi:MAG: tRNA (adenine(22)-N(1))-methyltransferase TrmK [Candidatus Dormibacteraeota bacterium]|nr:tRNA (adenine(22)-N(1))-methyltransferase TrmK [Candidatus Dormibacteraeota bacterium]
METVPEGARSVADVGAGDGQVALALARSGTRVIAIERTPRAVERLRRATAGWCEVRSGDGLSVLAPGEVEGCVIAGLGGLSIAGILGTAPEQLRALRWLVLGPHSDNHRLELWLAGAGLRLREVRFVVERRRLYQIMVVQS